MRLVGQARLEHFSIQRQNAARMTFDIWGGDTASASWSYNVLSSPNLEWLTALTLYTQTLFIPLIVTSPTPFNVFLSRASLWYHLYQRLCSWILSQKMLRVAISCGDEMNKNCTNAFLIHFVCWRCLSEFEHVLVFRAMTWPSLSFDQIFLNLKHRLTYDGHVQKETVSRIYAYIHSWIH